MPDASPNEVTRLLCQWSDGDEEALERLMPLIYAELKCQAAGYLEQERPGHTLDTQDLVHEAFLRLVDQRHVDWRNRAHFFAVAARMMRRVLVDHARRRARSKRGGGWRRVVVDDMPDLAGERGTDVEALDQALDELARIDADLARIVEMRFFGGLYYDEIAPVLGVSKATVRRRWDVARAWLYRRLSGEDPDAA